MHKAAQLQVCRRSCLRSRQKINRTHQNLNTIKAREHTHTHPLRLSPDALLSHHTGPKNTWHLEVGIQAAVVDGQHRPIVARTGSACWEVIRHHNASFPLLGHLLRVAIQIEFFLLRRIQWSPNISFQSMFRIKLWNPATLHSLPDVLNYRMAHKIRFHPRNIFIKLSLTAFPPGLTQTITCLVSSEGSKVCGRRQNSLLHPAPK